MLAITREIDTTKSGTGIYWYSACLTPRFCIFNGQIFTKILAEKYDFKQPIKGFFMEKMTHIRKILNTNSDSPLFYDFGENSPVKKYTEWESPHLVLPVQGGNTDNGMEQALVEPLWPGLTLPITRIFYLEWGLP